MNQLNSLFPLCLSAKIKISPLNRERPCMGISGLKCSSGLYFTPPCILLCSPPGPPGGRRRMGRISYGGGPNAPPMGGGWGRWVSFSAPSESINMFMFLITRTFSSGKRLHWVCRRGAWRALCWEDVLRMISAQCWRSFFISCHCRKQFLDASLGIPAYRGQIGWHSS